MALKRQRNMAVGKSEPFVDVFPIPIVAQRDPGTADRSEVGTIWVNRLQDEAFVLTSIVANVSNWANFTGGAGVFDSITLNPGPFTQTGAGAHTVNITGAIDLDSTVASHFIVTGAGADLTLSSVGGRVIIDGSEAVANAVTIDASDAFGGIDIDSGTGGITADSDGAISITSTVAATGGAILLNATGAGSGVSISGDSLITLNTPTVPGNIVVISAVSSVAGAASTLNTLVGVSEHTGLTTAAGAFETITITNDNIAAGSGILVSAQNLGVNDAKMTVARVLPAAGTFDVILENRGAAALNGNLTISFWVIG